MNVCGAKFGSFGKSAGVLRSSEAATFKNNPPQRLKTGLYSLGFLLSLGLTCLKYQNQSETWACTTAETPLYTGPNAKDYPQVGTLNQGNCSKVILAATKWISLAPQKQAAGWANKDQVLIVRGNKFDPLFNKD